MSSCFSLVLAHVLALWRRDVSRAFILQVNYDFNLLNLLNQFVCITRGKGKGHVIVINDLNLYHIC